MITIQIFCLLFLLLINNDLFSQSYCISNRFTDDYYFASRDIRAEKDIIYGKATNYKGRVTKLDMDIYYPKQSVDTLISRPLIMLFHGGGFRRQDKTQTEKYCPLFAQRGFVVANINYRLGYTGMPGDSTSMLAVYRAVQDAYSALCYLINNSKKYGIDPNSVFLGGRSAGGVISLALAYMGQSDFYKAYPYLGELLGDIDNATDLPKAGFTIKGVINMWGVESIESFISPPEAQEIPVIMFYGTEDNTYNKCIVLAETMKRHNGCYQLHSRIGAGHAEDMSKFYIAAKTGCFIKHIFCGSCNSSEWEIDNQDLACDNVLAIDRIPVNRPSMKLDPSILREYVGNYFTVGEDGVKRMFIVTIEDDHLFIQRDIDETKVELYPESEIDFFIKEANVQFSFNKNKNDKVTGLTFYMDAKETNGKKKK